MSKKGPCKVKHEVKMRKRGPAKHKMKAILLVKIKKCLDPASTLIRAVGFSRLEVFSVYLNVE